MEKQNIDWAMIREKLPFERTKEQYKRRSELWKSVDVNGNGIVSLAELDKAMADVFNLFHIYKTKEVMMRAFQAAKDKHPPKHALSDDYIERAEFRILLQYLREYFEYSQAFGRIDKDGDDRIDKEEFIKGIPVMNKWVKEDVTGDTFDEIDTNGGGKILFSEFCRWAIKKSLDLEDDDEEE